MKIFQLTLFFFLFIFLANGLLAQGDPFGKGMGRIRNMGQSMKGSSNDTLQKVQRRTNLEDSITIFFRYLDSSGAHKPDSSILDFHKRFFIPSYYAYLGNTGTAGHSLLFDPAMKSGLDYGLHAYDYVKWGLKDAKFYNTTRPYTELNYELASQSEQVIHLLHTQNITPLWNMQAQYRLINAPGIFRNQKTIHNNYNITSWYRSKNVRYNNFAIFVSNKIRAKENGGVVNAVNVLKNPLNDQRLKLPTYLGEFSSFLNNPFSNFSDGTSQTDFAFFVRQQYDFGKKDSIVTDSTVIPLYYPRIRLEYNATYSQNKLRYFDPVADSSYYDSLYTIKLRKTKDTVLNWDKWSSWINDFSIYQYPDIHNQNQFFKVGLSIENAKVHSTSDTASIYNIFGHGEYRNKTRNGKWNMLLQGNLYFAGYNAGDYDAHASLMRSFGKKYGSLLIGFENNNRRPSYVYDSRSSYWINKQSATFKKSNVSQFFAIINQPAIGLRLLGNYYILTNYTYFRSYYKPLQEGTLFTIIKTGLEKKTRVYKKIYWYSDVYLQKNIGAAPVNLPLFYTRNRIGYEGDFGFKKLNVALGAEFRYHSPYYAEGYAPATGQFFYQDSVKIKYEMPDINVYLHFRISSFKAYIRAENVNTATIKDGLNFLHNNFAAPDYPYQGFMLRVGIFWGFVN